MSLKVELGKLSEDAIELAAAGIYTGQLTLKSGKIIVLDPEHILRLIQWAATQRERKHKFLASADDFNLKPTKRTSDAA